MSKKSSTFAGRKYKTINYTNMRTVNTDYNDIAYYTYETDSVQYQVTEYLGNIMNIRTKEDTIITDQQKILNSTGYYTDGKYFHYVKNHSGSICVVMASGTDSVVQNTSYLASGLPSSTDLDEQPYLYNGKEFIEAHGWNTYDYSFRGYYATIGRFTTVDPLAEQTPWQSPYAYAGNNFINAIDWMGLSIVNINDGSLLEWDRMIESLRGNIILHYTELNNDGTVKEHIDNGDNSVVYEGDIIGTEIDGERYEKGRRVYIKRIIGGYVKYFDVKGGWYIGLHDEWEDKVAKWMRWKGIGKHEKENLEAIEPIALNAVLCIPILSQVNDAMILIIGENLYGQQADDLDKAFAISSLLTLGAGKLAPVQDVADGLKKINIISSVGSFSKSLKQEYETKY